MDGNKHKNQTQHMETANTHKALEMWHKRPNKLNTKTAKNMGENKKKMW